MIHNYEIILELKDSLCDKDKDFIENKIESLKNEYGLSQFDNIIYRNQSKISYDDVPFCLMFCLNISKYRKYFKRMTYNNFLEGVKDGKI